MLLTDAASGLTLRADADTADFFDDLEILLARMFEDEVLLVKERN